MDNTELKERLAVAPAQLADLEGELQILMARARGIFGQANQNHRTIARLAGEIANYENALQLWREFTAEFEAKKGNAA